ncbi:hypothetical protein G0A00_12885 [Yangia sp. PrR002]|nr:hypothetical protein [Salipiger sp. PrR002]
MERPQIMGPDFATASLQDTHYRRKSRVMIEYQRCGYEESFDATTLWFDAIWEDGYVTLICPRLNNFAALFRRGRLSLDGQRVRAKIQTFYRHSVVLLRSPTRPQRIALEIDGHVIETDVRVPETARFRDKNVILTMSKDNDLCWIEDFARFHAETQGAEAIIFIDNGSTSYTRDELQDVLENAGLDALILRTELPFGPRGVKPYANRELFLQTCALNSARLRFLREARAVLSCDIDELVLSQGMDTVFDVTARSWIGFTRFKGVWRYAISAEEGTLVRHKDHAFRKAEDKPCPPKWCIRPSGPLGKVQWRTHELEGFMFNWAFNSSAFLFHHCRQITTGWKRTGRFAKEGEVIEDVPAMTLVRRAQGLSENPPASPMAGVKAAARRFVERAFRDFFAWRVSSQILVSTLVLVCSGVVLEEAVDDDPAQQEISAIVAGVKNLIGS